MEANRLAIVGSGRIRFDQSRMIDACNPVIRFNECKNYGRNCGRRTDILCLTNTGGPAMRMIREAPIRSAPYRDGVTEVWLPRDSGVHAALGVDMPADGCLDVSAELLERSALADRRVIRFDAGLNERVFRELQRRSARPFTCPSTGILAIEYVAGQARFDGYEKYIFGFSFRGWEGHPWRAERDLVHARVAARRDLHWVSTWRLWPWFPR